VPAIQFHERRSGARSALAALVALICGCAHPPGAAPEACSRAVGRSIELEGMLHVVWNGTPSYHLVQGAGSTVLHVTGNRAVTGDTMRVLDRRLVLVTGDTLHGVVCVRSIRAVRGGTS
jgi:hypothetical protein